MLRARRFAVIVVLAGLATLTAACGVDGGDTSPSASGSDTTATTTAGSEDEPDSTTTEPPELTETQKQVVESIAKTYREFGFSDEEAQCLAEGMAGSMNSGSDPADMTDIMGVINDCDIPMERFTDIQENLGGGSTEDVMKKSMEAGFRNLGMTDEQASCVADAYVEEFGTDVTAGQDPTKLQPLLEQCDVDPRSLRPGG